MLGSMADIMCLKRTKPITVFRRCSTDVGCPQWMHIYKSSSLSLDGEEVYSNRVSFDSLHPPITPLETQPTARHKSTSRFRTLRLVTGGGVFLGCVLGGWGFDRGKGGDLTEHPGPHPHTLVVSSDP